MRQALTTVSEILSYLVNKMQNKYCQKRVLELPSFLPLSMSDTSLLMSGGPDGSSTRR